MTGAASREPAPQAVPAVSAPPPSEPLPAFRTPLPVRARRDPAPAKRYAALSSKACLAELRARGVDARPIRGQAKGVETPLRLGAPLAGVRFELPRNVYGLMDCRLVLVLDDLARLLHAHGVAGVQVNNTYRPGSVLPPKTAPRASGSRGSASTKVRERPARGGKGKRAKPSQPARPSQHARGLAIDITEFRLADGRILNVERDWRGQRGAPPCGPESRVEGSAPEGVLLRDLTCAIARHGLCNHLITPNRDPAHDNHLHCDIEAGASEIMVE